MRITRRELLLFLLAEALVLALLFAQREYLARGRLELRAVEVEAAVETVIHHLGTASELAFQQSIVSKNTRDELLAAHDPEQVALARGRLYRHIYPLHTHIRRHGLQELLIRLRDGTPLLSLMRPDYLPPKHPLHAPRIPIARNTLVGLEVGETIDGVRFTHSYFDDEGVLGSVEFVADVDGLEHELKFTIDELIDLRLLYAPMTLQQGLPTARLNAFSPARINPAYMEPTTESSGDAAAAIELLAGMRVVQSRMARQHPFATLVWLDRTPFIASFIPMKSTRGQHAGYLVALTQESCCLTHWPTSLLLLLGTAVALATGVLLRLSGHSERRLNDDPNRLRAIADHAPAGIYATDSKGRITYANRSVSTLLKYPPEQLMGRQLHELLRPPELSQRLLTQSLSDDGFHSDDAHFVCADGSALPVEVSGSPWDQQGRRAGTVVLFYDIVERKRAQAELQATQEKLAKVNVRLQQLAITDGLTGLRNRRHFDRRLSREWRRGMGEQKPLSLILLDVDHFKLFNDSYGHQRGDECLRQVGALMRQRFRDSDAVAARYGGEEFAVILPQTGLVSAVRVAEQLQLDIAESNILFDASPVADRITVSIGIASSVPHAENSLDRLISAADEQLYRAKAAGRDRIRYTILDGDEGSSAGDSSNSDLGAT